MESAEALIGEARALWRAERADEDAPVDALGASWGCVALLKNPKRKIPNSWLSYWKETAAKDPQPPYGLERAAKEKPVVDHRHPPYSLAKGSGREKFCFVA